jgi:hypothetical protein
MPQPRRIEGYAIVSEDGMLANAEGIKPDTLKFEADQRFFERGLDRVDVVVHGRHSHERQPRSQLRRRLIMTHKVAAGAADPSNDNALFWNPAGASFEQALTALGMPDGSSEKRLARALLLLANFGKEGKPEPIIAKVSQESLAEMIGTTRSRVSHFMNKFRQLGFIDDNGHLQVHSALLSVVLNDQPHIKR